MSVIVNVIGADLGSDEFLCAQKLKDILDTTLPKSATGSITLHANAQMIGQDVKDIDLMMMGSIQNYSVRLTFTDRNDGQIKNDFVQIRSFCTAIEIKSHDIDGIVLQGTEFYVKYGRGLHSVTSQSNKQKIAIHNFFLYSIGMSPYVTNVIWFTGITEADVHGLLSLANGEIPSNILGGVYSAENIFQLLVMENQPYSYYDASKRSNTYFFDSNNRIPVDTLETVFEQLAKAKNSMGELTRKRIEQITTKAITNQLSTVCDSNMTILRGRAGTGKTVGLIQNAIKMVDEFNARVLILTYNRALVSDIKRLFALADLPDMFQEACVTISTMQSFFYRLISLSLYRGELRGGEFLKNYVSYLTEMTEYLRIEGNGKATLRELLGKDYYIDWDYCFVDEAQDWTREERDLLLAIFPGPNIMIADGGLQYVRMVENCDWNIVENRKPVKLKYCLRQKSNIVRFINHYLEKIDVPEQKINFSDKVPGGKIVIHQGTDIDYPYLKQELSTLKKAGNIPYDMLILAPYTMVEKNPRRFILKEEFEHNDLLIWDGTNEEVRQNYSTMGDEIRVLQYESARGLEAWTVVCLELDTFLEERMASYDEEPRKNALLLESSAERRKKYLLNWLLIPWTRAIDTLIITIKNPESNIAKTLCTLAHEHPDYIRIQ